ncbi:MAG: hypothetical protein LBU90_07795 [Bacteroidales bacterium]|jgi:ABC-type phosphate transport system substrate-binding protein|nr:hypothetical protein [Bacteroidales bacterium]
MKTKGRFLAAVLTLLSATAWAQTVYVGNAKFVQPIVEKLISEYAKENPQSHITLSNEETANNAAIFIVAQPTDTRGRVVYVGKYALLPVSNVKNPLIVQAGKGLKKSDLSKLFFEQVLEDEDDEEAGGYYRKEKEKYTATVYARQGAVSTSITLATAYNATPERLRGKKIIGDDIHLVSAVQRDETGIAFNTLNYVFDTESRQLKQNVAILPIHAGAKLSKSLQSNNIDAIISILEDTDIEQIPVSRYGLQVPETLSRNADVQHFVQWVLAHSAQFNHEYGFLNLSNKESAEQQTRLELLYQSAFTQ